MTDYTFIGFFCDTVRQEAAGRSSLIGVLPSRMEVPQFPFIIQVGAFVRISPLPPEDASVRVMVRLGKTVLIDTVVPRTPRPPEPIELPHDEALPPNPLMSQPALHIVLDRVMLHAEAPAGVGLWGAVGDEELVCITGFRLILAPNGVGQSDIAD